MELIKKITDNIWVMRTLYSILTIIIGCIVYAIVTNSFVKAFNNKLFNNKKTKTYIKLTKSILRYVIILVTFLVILSINGVNITSMLAGVGIIGIILGFAVQDALKDIIKGFDIISDTYYQVGDVIKYKEITGKVLAIGLKTTKVEDVYSLNIVSISNRNIEQVEVVSHLINIDIPMPYDVKLEEAENAIDNILGKVKQIKNVEKCEYRGVNDLGESGIKYQIKVYCDPLIKVQMRRDVLRCILVGLDECNIQVPFTQIDVHQK